MKNILTNTDPILFLDMDGVVNTHEKLSSGYCGFRQENVGRLNGLLDDIPSLKIVLTTSWRYLILRGDMTIKGFEMLMLIGGIKCHERIVGHTISDGAVEDEPDHQDAEAWREAGLRMRAKQIQCYVAEHGVHRFAVVDDLPLEVENFVQTNPSEGLMPRHIEQLKGLLDSGRNP